MHEKSTTVRFLRLGARLTAALAPELAARWLERLFLTPIRYPVPEREVAWMETATAHTLPFDGDRTLRVSTWGRGPTVLLVHGWAGRGSQMGAFVEPLVERGYRVVAFDAPAHGGSEGRSTGLPEVADAVERVAAWAGPIEGVVAHSLGTAATTIAMARGLSIRRAVYVAPPESPGIYLYRAAKFLRFGDEVARRAQARIERRFAFPFAETRGTTLARGLDVPLLVIHDEADAEVPHDEGAALAAGWPGAVLLTTRGLGHHRILRAPEVVAAAVGFVTEATRPPSWQPAAGRHVGEEVAQP